MTTFGDMVYQLGGMPVVGGIGLLSHKDSNYYFVDKRDGSSGNSGLKFKFPLDTIAAAVTLMNDDSGTGQRINWSSSPWAMNDILIIAPGSYAENLTALPYGCVMLGTGDSFDLNGEGGVVIKPATGSAVDATSVINTRIHNISFMQTATAAAIFQADNFNRNVLTHCLFAGIPGASPTTTRGLEVVKDCTGSRVVDAFFLQVKNGIYINTDNANSKQITGTLFEDIYIGACDTTGFYFDINANPSMVYINKCNVGDNSTTLALGLDDNTDQVTVANTNFWATANDPATGGTYYNNCYLNGALIT